MQAPRDLDLLDPRLKPLCDAVLARSRIVGASVAVVADDVAYHYAYGSKSVETGEPVTADTSFNTTNINLVGLAQTGIEYIPL